MIEDLLVEWGASSWESEGIRLALICLWV